MRHTMMELEDLLSDLHALTKLYGLLHTKASDDDDDDHVQQSASLNLDDKAKLLLKRLLDAATEQAFQSHAKIVAEQSAASTMNCISTKNPQQTNNPSKTRSNAPASSNCSSSSKYLMNCDSMNSRSKKRCKICGKSAVKRLSSSKEKKTSSNENQNHDQTIIINNNNNNNNNSEAVDGHAKEFESKEKGKEGTQEMQKTSNDQVIDAREPFNHQMMNPVLVSHLIKENTGLLSHQMPVQKALPDKTESTQTQEFAEEKNKLPSQITRPLNAGKDSLSFPRELVQATDELPSRLPNQIDGKPTMTTLPGQRAKLVRERNELPPSQKKDSKGKLSTSQASSTRKAVLERINSVSKKSRNRKKIGASSTLPVQTTPARLESVGPGANIMRYKTTRKEKSIPNKKMSGGPRSKQPNQTAVMPTLLDQPPRGTKLGPTQNKHQYEYQRIRGAQKKAQEGPSMKKLARQQEAEGPTSTSASPSWTTEEYTNTSSESSEVNSMPRKTSTQQCVGPLSQRELSYAGRIQGTRAQLASEKSGRRHQRRGDDLVVQRPTHRAAPAGISRLRRLKNKLGLIFHHHHHHHHHHHNNNNNNTDDDDSDSDNDKDQVGHARTRNQDHSLLRHMRNMMHGRGKEDAEAEGVTRGVRRSVQHYNHHQQGHLHALVDGFLSHVWHSKKSKPSNHEIERLGKGRKKKKVVKKWHWWQRRVSKHGSNARVGINARRLHLPSPKRLY